jgi:hypothetical protein
VKNKVKILQVQIPRYGLLQIKTYSPTGLRRVHLCVKKGNAVLSNQLVYTQVEIKILKQDI